MLIRYGGDFLYTLEVIDEKLVQLPEKKFLVHHFGTRMVVFAFLWVNYTICQSESFVEFWFQKPRSRIESIKNRVLFLSISFPFYLVCSDLSETSLVDLSCSCLVSSFRKLFLHLFLPHFFSSEVSFSWWATCGYFTRDFILFAGWVCEQFQTDSLL